jgi:hypothetical protein
MTPGDPIDDLQLLYSPAITAAPADRIRTAWGHPGFRDEAIGLIVRSIEKTGSLVLADPLPTILGNALLQEERVNLYRRISEAVLRPEFEWRTPLASALSVPPSCLPELSATDRAGQFTTPLFTAIAEADLPTLQSILNEMERVGVAIHSVTMLGYRPDVEVTDDTPAVSPQSDLCCLWTPIMFAESFEVPAVIECIRLAAIRNP